MTRYRMTVEYDGGGYVGWQRQRSGPSVQAALEEAVHGFCGEAVRVFGAGRTDAGVHALGQVAHVDIARPTDAGTLLAAVNAHLGGQPVAVVDAREVGGGFDARLSATLRVYRYRILNRRAPAALERGRVWHLGAPLDDAAMREGALRLVGRHDFTTFRAVACQARSPVRTLDALEVRRRGDEVRVTAEARSFLHRQVRNMVGTLARVGAGAWSPADVSAALAARDRAAGGPTAPAHGLCLVEVRYGDGAPPPK